MGDFDFIKAFAGVDLLAVEAVGTVIGRVEGAIFKGLVEKGVSEDDAHKILRAAHAEFFKAFMGQVKG